MSLARKISIFTAALAIFISMGIGTAAIFVSSRMAEGIISQSLQRQAEMGASLVRTTLESQLFTLKDLASREALASMKWETQRPVLAREVERLGYQDLGVVDRNGSARFAVSEATVNISDEDYVKLALRGSRAVSDVLISKVTKKPAVMLAVPIPGKNGEPAGALIAREDGNSLSEITDAFGFGDTGYAYLASREGRIVAHRNRGLVSGLFNPIVAAAREASLRPLANAFKAICSGTKGAVEYDYGGKRIISGYAPVFGMNWSIAVTAEKKELMSGIPLLARMIAAGAAIFLAVGIAGAMLIGRAMAKPVKSMLPVLEAISGGDLTRRLEISSSDEFGTMSERFNLSIEGLSTIVSSAKSMTGRIDGIVDDLSARMTETAAFMSRIASGIAAIKERTTSQAASVTESHAAVKEIRNGIERHDELVGKQASAIAEASAAIEEMIANIGSVAGILELNASSMEETLIASERGREGIERVSSIIEGIEKDSDGLIEASDVIQSVASRTNLLAMNAAIKGAMDEELKGNEKVLEAIEEIDEAMSDVASTSKAMLDGFGEVLDEIGRMMESAVEISGGMDEMAAGTGQVDIAVKEVNEGARSTRDSIATLSDELSRFKV